MCITDLVELQNIPRYFFFALYNLKEKLTRVCLPLYMRYLYVLFTHAIIFKCTWINAELVKNC